MNLKILSGQFKGHPLQSPSGKKTRPTQGILRQAVFNICQQQIEGAQFLDLFAGSGAMGLEALSRGARSATFVEQDHSALCCIRENIARLHLEDRTSLIAKNVSLALKQLAIDHLIFDIIYIDPPYTLALTIGFQLLTALETHSLIAPGGFVFVEESSQEKEISYQSESLRKKTSRRFGIARLCQFEYEPKR